MNDVRIPEGGLDTAPRPGSEDQAPTAPRRVVPSEIRAPWVVLFCVCVVVFAGLCGVVVAAASSFDGGIAGVTAPADNDNVPVPATNLPTLPDAP